MSLPRSESFEVRDPTSRVPYSLSILTLSFPRGWIKSYSRFPSAPSIGVFFPWICAVNYHYNDSSTHMLDVVSDTTSSHLANYLIIQSLFINLPVFSPSSSPFRALPPTVLNLWLFLDGFNIFISNLNLFTVITSALGRILPTLTATNTGAKEFFMQYFNKILSRRILPDYRHNYDNYRLVLPAILIYSR